MFIEAFRDHQVQVKTTDTLTTDSLVIRLSLFTEFYSQSVNWSFASSASALKKQENGSSGFKNDDIVSFDFVSDREFMGVPAGMSLNSFFVRLLSTGQAQTMESTIAELNGSSPTLYPDKLAQMNFFLTNRPPGVSTHLISLVTVFQSGKTHNTSAEVRWK